MCTSTTAVLKYRVVLLTPTRTQVYVELPLFATTCMLQKLSSSSADAPFRNHHHPCDGGGTKPCSSASAARCAAAEDQCEAPDGCDRHQSYFTPIQHCTGAPQGDQARPLRCDQGAIDTRPALRGRARVAIYAHREIPQPRFAGQFAAHASTAVVLALIVACREGRPCEDPG